MVTEAGSCSRRIDSCITQRTAQGPSTRVKAKSRRNNSLAQGGEEPLRMLSTEFSNDSIGRLARSSPFHTPLRGYLAHKRKLTPLGP